MCSIDSGSDRHTPRHRRGEAPGGEGGGGVFCVLADTKGREKRELMVAFGCVATTNWTRDFIFALTEAEAAGEGRGGGDPSITKSMLLYDVLFGRHIGPQPLFSCRRVTAIAAVRVFLLNSREHLFSSFCVSNFLAAVCCVRSAPQNDNQNQPTSPEIPHPTQTDVQEDKPQKYKELLCSIIAIAWM